MSYPLALSKRLPLELVHRDAEVNELFIQDKLTRQSSWATLRAIASQLEALGIQNPMTRSLPPSDCFLRPASREEERVVDPHSGFPAVQDASGALVDVIPDTFSTEDVFVVSNVADRGSSGEGGMNYACGLLTWASRKGVMHDGWNSCRNGAKAAEGGQVWRSIVRMAAVQNLPYGPFRFGAWGRRLQSAHTAAGEENWVRAHI